MAMPRKDPTVTVTIRVPEKMKEKLDLASWRTGRSLNAYIGDVLERHCRHSKFCQEEGPRPER